MKYMVPEINISKFSLENIVTESAIQQAKQALVDAGVNTSYTAVTRVTMSDWVEAN